MEREHGRGGGGWRENMGRGLGNGDFEREIPGKWEVGLYLIFFV